MGPGRAGWIDIDFLRLIRLGAGRRHVSRSLAYGFGQGLAEVRPVIHLELLEVPESAGKRQGADRSPGPASNNYFCPHHIEPAALEQTIRGRGQVRYEGVMQGAPGHSQRSGNLLGIEWLSRPPADELVGSDELPPSVHTR
jgi:hypothetical protein